MSEEQSKLLGEMTAHNSTQLKQFFEGSAIEGNWQLVFAASYNGCILSLPAKGGGQVRLRIAARYLHETPYLELRAERMGGEEDDMETAGGAEKAETEAEAGERARGSGDPE